ncbi:MAG: phage holin family protein [Candidatus Daviesbacteria bacterium]|nr:phage holin family protein [Candidatus Daviesbacteria bacterium]
MKSLLRSYLVNMVSLWVTTQILPALSITDGFKGLLIASVALMGANMLLIPLLKILLLPLNLLTVGLFSWLTNVIALYFLVTVIPSFKISSFYFSGLNYDGFSLPPLDLSPFFVVVIASFLIGLIHHFLKWLIR